MILNNNKDMNTYAKYCPNVFLAKCEEKYEKGETILVTTKYGKENESIVFNLILEKDGFYYYSIVRADGFNSREWAKRRAEKLEGYASNAEKRSDEWREKSNEGKDFLVLAEPIKVGHHSEKRHRALIERNHRRMDNAMEELKKAESYQSRIQYWESKANEINLSMPESLEFYEYKLAEAKEYHEGLKSGKYPKQHSFDVQYANKKVKELTKKYNDSVKLWGD